MIRSFSAIIIFLMLYGSSGLFATTTSGVLKNDEVWEGIVNITGDVVVPEGVTLVIRANALIKFTPNRDDRRSGYDPTKCELIVEGILRAEGREKYEIRFTSGSFALPGEANETGLQPQAGDWYGIVFKKGNHDKSIISYSLVEFAYDGITCVNASPRIFRNRIEGNYWNGILCEIMSNPKINSNQLLNNGYAGLNCKTASAPTVSGNEITGNRYGILIQDVASPVLGDERLGENIGKNTIYANLEFNLYNHTKNVVYAQRNDWGDNINADKLIYDDDENRKYGLVVYTPVYSSGKISYLEFQTLATVSESGGDAADDTEKKREELEELKKQIAAKKELEAGKPKDKATELVSKEEEQKRIEEAQKEAERLKLLEDQIKQQERIKLEQEKQLAEQKKRDEEEQRKVAAAAAAKPAEKKETKSAAPVFIPTKMANELDNDPKPIRKVKPVMPDLAANARISGTVSLRVLVGVDGQVEEAYVSKRIGNKDFDQMINEAAIACVKQWEFEKGLSNGQPVKYWTIVGMLMK